MPGPRPGVSTPQFRTLLIRRLGNLFPDLNARIEGAPRGIVFQLFEPDGTERTNRVNLYRHSRDTLTSASLKAKILSAGRPAGGFPANLDPAA